MRIYLITTAALLLAPTPIGAVPAASVSEVSSFVLVQDTQPKDKDKAKKAAKKKSSTSSSQPAPQQPVGRPEY